MPLTAPPAIQLQFDGSGSDDALDEVRQAIRLERRAARRSRMIEVVSAEPLSAAEPILRVEIHAERAVRDAKRWRGATLDRPLGALIDAPAAVHAEVIEVDAERRILYVTTDLDTAIAPGAAQLHPFDFLRAPDTLLTTPRLAPLHERLKDHLAAARGHLRGLPIDAARPLDAWNCAWGLVWGPPGTGKTYTLGQRVAELLKDPTERVLVLSTTHKAADAAALQLGAHAVTARLDLTQLRRVGWTTEASGLRDRGLAPMLPGQDEICREIERLQHQLKHASDVAIRARLQHRLGGLRTALPSLRSLALDESVRGLVATLHAGLGLLTDHEIPDLLTIGHTPFTTVVLDEAGLIPRATAAAAGLLASRRVVLVGDPKQLSPIAQAARSRPRSVMTWIAKSPLEHLEHAGDEPHVQRLDKQRRMHPDIRAGVSALQYEGALSDADSVLDRAFERPGLGSLLRQRRLLWIPPEKVPGVSIHEAQSTRGPKGSRVRPATLVVLQRLLDLYGGLADEEVLFISPFRAQAEAIAAWAKTRCPSWSASTVHAQQGTERPVVIFDTVHASSTTWDASEWRRLVNVGLSRAEQLVVLIATEAELSQHWLYPLVPKVCAVIPRKGALRPVEARLTQTEMFGLQRGILTAAEEPTIYATQAGDDDRLGDQIRARRTLRSVLSQEQHRLVHRDLSDAGPRLVRGVAGSGKTLVLARWAARALHSLGLRDVLIVYANVALRPILERLLHEAWRELTHNRPLPVERVNLRHINDLLRDLERERGLPSPRDRAVYDYEARAQGVLASGVFSPRYSTILIDEAQDLGEAPIELLVQLAETHREGQRAVMIFYDNAQNIYRRRTPNWKRLGLDMRGRSDVMNESFRTTRPILELAHYLCDQIQPIEAQPEIRELLRRGLLRKSTIGGHTTWHVEYCGVDGQIPEVSLFGSVDEEHTAIAEQVRRWIDDEHVDPDDIRIIVCRTTDGQALVGALERAGVSAAFAASVALAERALIRSGQVLVSTAASFKGYDAEVVVVARADRFAGSQGVYVPTLYVALTRARTHLWVTGCVSGDERLVRALTAAETPGRRSTQAGRA